MNTSDFNANPTTKWDMCTLFVGQNWDYTELANTTHPCPNSCNR